MKLWIVVRANMSAQNRCDRFHLRLYWSSSRRTGRGCQSSVVPQRCSSVGCFPWESPWTTLSFLDLLPYSFLDSCMFKTYFSFGFDNLFSASESGLNGNVPPPRHISLWLQPFGASTYSAEGQQHRHKWLEKTRQSQNSALCIWVSVLGGGDRKMPAHNNRVIIS